MFFLTCFSECVLTDSRSLVFTRCASSLSLNWATPRWVWSLPSGYFYWQVISAGNLSHVTEYCWIFSCVLSMQHICFLVLFPFLFNFLRKLKLFLWVRRNQSCIQLKCLQSSAQQPCGRVERQPCCCVTWLKLHVDWLCVVSVMQYSSLWLEPVWKSCFLSKPVPGVAAGHASL